MAGRPDAAVGEGRQQQRRERRQLAGHPGGQQPGSAGLRLPEVRQRRRKACRPGSTAARSPPPQRTSQSEKFQNTEFKYFGGQKANQIFAESAEERPAGWSYLPFQVYANSIFNDTVGQAYVSGTKLEDGLKAWQEASVKYGTEQGFTVKE